MLTKKTVSRGFVFSLLISLHFAAQPFHDRMVCGQSNGKRSLIQQSQDGKSRDDEALSTQQKKEDLQFLVKELAARHKDLFAVQSTEEFDRQANSISEKLNQLDDRQFQFELSRLIASVKDGHTSLTFDNSEMRYYPLNVRWFDDQLAVVAAATEFKDILGAKIVSINDVPTDQLLTSIRPYLSVDNEYGFRNRVDQIFNNADLLAYAAGLKSEQTEDRIILEKSGQRIEKKIPKLTPVQSSKIRWEFANRKFPLYVQKSNLNFWNDWLADSGTLYFKYNRCADAAGFQKLVQGTKGFVQQNRVERFVVDVRNNGGGNSAVFLSLKQYLQSEEQFRRPGKLFVIVGRGTFSGGLWAAYDMKNLGAVVVGEPTGGKPNHFGEIKSFRLPNSKLTVFYSTRFWQFLSDEDPESLTPDIRVEFNANDYFSGKDPAMEAILDYQPQQ